MYYSLVLYLKIIILNYIILIIEEGKMLKNNKINSEI